MAHKNILLSNSIPQAPIRLKHRCKSCINPLGEDWEDFWNHMVSCENGGDHSSLTEYKREIIENLLAVMGDH